MFKIGSASTDYPISAEKNIGRDELSDRVLAVLVLALVRRPVMFEATQHTIGRIGKAESSDEYFLADIENPSKWTVGDRLKYPFSVYLGESPIKFNNISFRLENTRRLPEEILWVTVPLTQSQLEATWLKNNQTKERELLEMMTLGYHCDELDHSLLRLLQDIRRVKGVLVQPLADEVVLVQMQALERQIQRLSSFFASYTHDNIDLIPKNYETIILNWSKLNFNPFHVRSAISSKIADAVGAYDAVTEARESIRLLLRADEVARKTGPVYNAGRNIFQQSGIGNTANDHNDQSIELNYQSKNWNWSAIFIHASLALILVGILTQRTETASKGLSFGNLVSAALSKVPVIGKFLDWAYTVLSAAK